MSEARVDAIAALIADRQQSFEQHLGCRLAKEAKLVASTPEVNVIQEDEEGASAVLEQQHVEAVADWQPSSEAKDLVVTFVPKTAVFSLHTVLNHHLPPCLLHSDSLSQVSQASASLPSPPLRPEPQCTCVCAVARQLLLDGKDLDLPDLQDVVFATGIVLHTSNPKLV